MSPGDIRGGRGDIRGGRGDIRVEDPENHILFKNIKNKMILQNVELCSHLFQLKI